MPKKLKLQLCRSSDNLYIINTIVLCFFVRLFVCPELIGKTTESQKDENLYQELILYCDNDLLVFEVKFGIMTSQLRKTDI